VINDVVLFTTVEDKTIKYTVREYSNAKKLHELQNNIGTPSTQDLIRYIDEYLIPNCPVIRQGIVREDDIFGPNIGLLNEKMM